MLREQSGDELPASTQIAIGYLRHNDHIDCGVSFLHWKLT